VINVALADHLPHQSFNHHTHCLETAMISFESCLRRVTRRIAFVRGGARLIEPLRRHYVKRYAGTPERWIVINDFDGDMRFRVDRASYMGSLTYWRGYHSYSELCCLARLLKPWMVFADVGANRGEFTVFAAKRLPDGRVLSFEPLRSTYQELLENVRLNDLKNVSTFECGLAEAAGARELYTSDDLTAHGSWHEGLGTLYQTDYRATLLGTVKLRKFDEVAQQSQLQTLQCMKIDVEGAELAVLQGARECIERFRPLLLLEINRETFEAAGYSKWEIIDFLRRYDYRLYRIGRHGSTTAVAIDDLPDFCCTLWVPPNGFSCSDQDLRRVLAA
jgi:FkbM family methyltransferase